MLMKFYRDANGHVVMVITREDGKVEFIGSSVKGLTYSTMSDSTFMRKYTHPVLVDTRKAVLSWYCRALQKPWNDSRALNLLKRYIMEDKNLDEMTMDELIEHHNKLATELGKPTHDTFKSLKAARAAIEKLSAPVEPKAAATNLGSDVRGPVQGVGAFAKDLILKGYSNKEALEATLAQFPTAKTTSACIAYYRSKLILAGKLQRTVKAAPAPVDTAPIESETVAQTEAA